MVKTPETNTAHTGYTTNDFMDRLTNPMTSEAMNRGRMIHSVLVTILITCKV
jgi:hypothetical protein